MDLAGLQAVLDRAHTAISRAKALSERFGQQPGLAHAYETQPGTGTGGSTAQPAEQQGPQLHVSGHLHVTAQLPLHEGAPDTTPSAQTPALQPALTPAIPPQLSTQRAELCSLRASDTVQQSHLSSTSNDSSGSNSSCSSSGTLCHLQEPLQGMSHACTEGSPLQAGSMQRAVSGVSGQPRSAAGSAGLLLQDPQQHPGQATNSTWQPPGCLEHVQGSSSATQDLISVHGADDLLATPSAQAAVERPMAEAAAVHHASSAPSSGLASQESLQSCPNAGGSGWAEAAGPAAAPAAAAPGAEPYAATGSTEVTTATAAASGVSEQRTEGGVAAASVASSSSAASSLFSTPLMHVARRLAALQQQQSSTLVQLLSLRREQLRLRQQQLSALQELLRAESAVVEGTPLQMSAVRQALSLLSQSLDDMDVAAAAIAAASSSACSGLAAPGRVGMGNAHDVASVAATVSCADARAEDISRMARQLLNVLREYPRRTAAAVLDGSASPGGTMLRSRTVIRGATDWELSQLPTMPCEPHHPLALAGEVCSICLGGFDTEAHLKSMPCAHPFHAACLDSWLRVKACCPLCKTPLPGTLLTLQLPAPAGPPLAATPEEAAQQQPLEPPAELLQEGMGAQQQFEPSAQLLQVDMSPAQAAEVVETHMESLAAARTASSNTAAAAPAAAAMLALSPSEAPTQEGQGSQDSEVPIELPSALQPPPAAGVAAMFLLQASPPASSGAEQE